MEELMFAQATKAATLKNQIFMLAPLVYVLLMNCNSLKIKLLGFLSTLFDVII